MDWPIREFAADRFARGEKGERKMSAAIENGERERRERKGWDLVGEPEVFRKTYGARCYQ